MQAMPSPFIPSLDRHEYQFNPAHHRFDYPELTPDAAICIGLTIDWRHTYALRGFALRHTHDEEHARAARFLRPEDGLRHLLGRALLRGLAMHYGGVAPDLPLPQNAWGKPEPAPHISCNLSHSGDQVWAALSYLPRLGIDVESAVAPADYRDIMRSFHPLEIEELQSLPDAGAAMMRCWARKEAVAKAVGMGLSLPLNAYAVKVDATRHAWVRVPPPEPARAAWTAIDLPLSGAYVGALAIAARCSHVTIFSLECVA